MSKRKAHESLNLLKKKICSNCKEEWPAELIACRAHCLQSSLLAELDETETPLSSHKQKIRIGDIFNYNEAGFVTCSICLKATAAGEFSTGKKWEAWKLDYLKRHLVRKVHTDSVSKLRYHGKGGILRMLTETVEDHDVRVELDERKKSKSDMVKS